MQLISHLAKHVGILKQCNPVMVAFRFLQPWPQTFVSDKKLRRCVASFPTVGIGQVDSKQNFVRAMLISSAAHTHTVWPKFQSSCFCEGSGPIVPVMEIFTPFEGRVGVWLRCYTKFPEKDVKCIKMFLVQGTVTASKTDHCSTRKHWNISASYILRWCCPAISDGLRTVFSCLVSIW